MKQYFSYFISAIIAIGLSQPLAYRDYEEGDKMIEESAVDPKKDPKMVLAFVAYTIPYHLTEAYEKAVRDRMKDSTKKGTFGFIQYVEVSKGHRRKHIGEDLVNILIKRVQKVEDFLALCLQAAPNDTPAIKLYTKLGFIKVAGDKSYALYALITDPKDRGQS